MSINNNNKGMSINNLRCQIQMALTIKTYLTSYEF